MSFHFEDPSDVKGFYDPVLLETPGEDLEERVQELEGKVDSLSRTLDLLQEILGIEVVVEVTDIVISLEADEI